MIPEGKKNIILIGFWSKANHDLSFSIIKNHSVFAIYLERLNKIKHYPSYGKFLSNQKQKDTNYITYIHNYLEENSLLKESTLVFFGNTQGIKDGAIETFGENCKFFSVNDHHFLHACSAYYPSNFTLSAVLCIDAMGANSYGVKETQTLWSARNNEIKKIDSYGNPQNEFSIGIVYTLFSSALGMSAGELMGLSSYGNKNRFKNIKIFDYLGGMRIKLNDSFLIGVPKDIEKKDILTYEFKNSIIAKNIYHRYGVQPSDIDHIVNQTNIHNSIFKDIAAHIQAETEKAVIYLAKLAYEKTQSTNLCIAGGVGLNVLANTKILKETSFENIFIQPAADDGGLSLGAVYFGYNKIFNQFPVFNNPGLGRTYSDGEIKNTIGDYSGKINASRENDIYKKTASLLYENNIIAWFQDGSEFGPRALGNRSIFASSFSREMHDRVNKVKKRQNWRPLAPIVLEDDIDIYFTDCKPSNYMTLVGTIHNHIKKIIPAIVHIDGTARYQSVNSALYPKVTRLLKDFKKLSGHSIIINTSLNVAEQPIVETPDDAIRLFLSTEIDYLVIHDYVLSKSKVYNEYSFQAQTNI